MRGTRALAGFKEAALGVLPAALWAVAFAGRASPSGLSLWWVQCLVAAWGAIGLWRALRRPDATSLGRRGSGGFGMTPVAVFSAAMLAVIYFSDVAHHHWVYAQGPKALALSATILLIWYADTFRPPVVLALGASGVMHALSFSQVAVDDLIRYWGIADGLVTRAGYSVTAGVPGSKEFYLVDLPVFPLTLLTSFAALGHRYAAAHAPLVVANVLLPFLYYALSRAVHVSRLRALVVALLIISFPQYQVYTLGAAQPDPLWAALLAGVLLAAARGAWLALGLTSAAAVLTRPEGAIYVGLILAGVAWTCRRRLRGVLTAVAVAAPPVAAFAISLYAQFGIPWASGGWTNVASSRYVLPNLMIALQSNLPQYAEVLGLPAPDVTGLGLAMLLGVVLLRGAHSLLRSSTVLVAAPLAIAANVLVILTSPTDLGADRLGPSTFFRHVSVCVPALVPLVALGVPDIGRLWRGNDSRGARLALAAVAALLLAAQHHVIGDTAARTGRGQLTALTSDPYVLIANLWAMDDVLPLLPFRAGPGRGTEIDPAFDFFTFRTALFAEARRFDLHVSDAGRSYIQASLAFGITGIATLALRPRPALAPP